MDKKEKVLIFENEIKSIKDKDIRKFVIMTLGLLPDYFFEIPASTTGKYHPQYSLGVGGLVRHTKSAVLFAKTLLELEMFDEQWNGDSALPYNVKFSDLDKDIIIASLILHDGLKCGEQQSKYTSATHPIDMANFIKKHTELCNILLKADNNKTMDVEDILFSILGCISSHMGQWNTDYKTKNVILPKPITTKEKFVHLCDYLASRKFIEIDFNKVE